MVEDLTDSQTGFCFYIHGLMNIVEFNNKQSGCSDLSKALEYGYQQSREAIKEHCK
jgi:hypothetical protein